MCVVLFAIGGLILINVPTFGFASSSSGGADQSAAKMHLDEAIKALQAGDTSSAKVHMTEADKVIQEGAAKMHLGNKSHREWRYCRRRDPCTDGSR